MRKDFDQLETVQFQQLMKPAALNIYKAMFPGCRVEDLRAEGINVHVLDKEFGIDSLLMFDSGQWVSIQEKYRKPEAMKYMDFTQEYMNGDGTRYESLGEWFKLGAQLYFYGWADSEWSVFERWVVLDIPRYKTLVELRGGLDRIGIKKKNRRHGSASFYAIPIEKLTPCIMATNIDSLNVKWKF